MLSIKSIKYTIPNNRIPVSQLDGHLNVSKATLRVFESFYGLKEILVCEDQTLFDFLSVAVEHLLSAKDIDFNKIKYLIHAHTTPVMTPMGCSLVQMIKEHFHLTQAMAFGTTMHKCVSSIKMFETLAVLLEVAEETHALLITGEIAFTPELRLIPRSSIAGDAATAILVSNRGNQHRLLATEIRLFPGYSKGFELSEAELQQFDLHFLNEMTNTILCAIKKANIELNDIKLILPHNVNHQTWKRLSEKMGISQQKIYTQNISRFGHAFASDGIINLATALENNALQPGDYYLMASCGMGFFFGCAVFKY